MRIILLMILLLLPGCLFKASKQLEYDAWLMASDECNEQMDELEHDKNIVNHRSNSNETQCVKKTYGSYPAAPVATIGARVQPAQVPNV